MKHKRQMFFSLMMVLSLLFSSFGAIHVYADDATPTSEVTEETFIDESSTEATPEAQATEEASAEPTKEAEENDPTATEAADKDVEDPAPAETEETPAPTEEPAVEGTAESTAETEATEPTPELSAEELDTLPEILENVPKGTEIVILNENGEPESMVSEEAAQTLVEGDPVWCPTGQTPGDADCTPSYGTFAELLAALQADGGTNYAGEGTIYVADSYSGNDDIAIEINGNNFTQFQSNNLTIQGGWDDGTGDACTLGISVFDVSLTINNWLGNITLNNLEFSNVSNEGGAALTVDTEGSVTLDNVDVYNSANNTNGAEINGNAGVTIQNSSSFNGNEGYGLIARSTGGNILLTSFSAYLNELTGAYLDTCLWDAASQTCTGSGDVSVDGATNQQNGQNGLQIDSGASSYITSVNLSDNSLSGLLLSNGTQGSSDFVSISGGSFGGNSGGSGINITQYGSGTLDLNSFGASNNQTGVIINSIGDGKIFVSDGSMHDNSQTGLHIESISTINLSSFSIRGNQNYGAYLLSDADIEVENGTFEDNAKNSNSQFAGLFAEANGAISINAINSNNQSDGGSVLLKSSDVGTIGITDANIFSNSTFGIKATNNDGNIVLNNVNVSTNDQEGSILKVLGSGNISVINGSVFTQNANHDLYAYVENGDIEIEDITVNSIFTSGSKVVLNNNGTGMVTVSDSQFSELSNSGLTIIADGVVTLNNNIFTNNTNHGVEIYSTYTAKPCYCSENDVAYVTVFVNGGTFSNNGQFGIYVKTDDENKLNLSGTEIFSTNVDGDYFIDTSTIPKCDDCGCSIEEKPDGKPYHVVEVPFNGSGNVPQDCNKYAGTLLQMEDGSFIKVACPFVGINNLKGINERDLPGPLGSEFDLGILLELLGEDGSLIQNSDGTITLNFVIPENSRGRTHQLLFWDPAKNDGTGGWIEMPPYEKGGGFMLHPDDPEDPRMIVSGVVDNGSTLSITVNFAGYFVVVGQ